jgi:hypothetical protein
VVKDKKKTNKQKKISINSKMIKNGIFLKKIFPSMFHSSGIFRPVLFGSYYSLPETWWSFLETNFQMSEKNPLLVGSHVVSSKDYSNPKKTK